MTTGYPGYNTLVSKSTGCVGEVLKENGYNTSWFRQDAQRPGDGKQVSALLSDLDAATIEEPLRATLLMLGKLTRQHTIDADDMRAALAGGASRQQIEDALAVCISFNVIGRLAGAFGFFVPGTEAFDAGAKYLLARGYR